MPVCGIGQPCTSHGDVLEAQSLMSDRDVEAGVCVGEKLPPRGVIIDGPLEATPGILADLAWGF